LSAAQLTAIVRRAVVVIKSRFPPLPFAIPDPRRFNGRSSFRVGGAVALLRSITVPWSVSPPRLTDKFDSLLRWSDPPFAVLPEPLGR
jgi:hypothetical protein